MNKILVIDDDPALADMIAEFCQGAGFEVKTVNHSPDAFKTAAAWKPHLITLDLEMPHMDGVEVLKQLQSNPDTAGIPVVVISVVARGALERGLLQSTRAVFEKPLRLQKLILKLTQLLVGQKSDKEPTFEPSREPKT
jgi:CheY-like chemotaxis protein